MINLYELYQTRLVTRWHTRPDVPSQTTGDHTIGMLLLLVKLHPNPSANLFQALVRHDNLGEYIGCDFPHKMKKEFPELKAIDEKMDVKAETYFSLQSISLTVEEKLWIKYLDQLEPLLYIHSIKPTEQKTIETAQRLMVMCNDLEKQLQAFGYLLEPESTVH